MPPHLRPAIEEFESAGYCILPLPVPEPVFQLRQRLLDELRRFVGDDRVELENYHQLIEKRGRGDEYHIEIQAHLTAKFREEKWHFEIFRKNLPLFQQLVGLDVDIEAEPYLRIVRPGKPQDNIGFHRDTIYGGSPYELSIFTPFVNLDPDSALCLEPGSHLKPDSDMPFVSIENPDPSITKGSLKHKLGFFYAPKVLDQKYPVERLIPIPLQVGEVIAFTLALLHGQAVNRSKVTRFSCDTRITNVSVMAENRSHRFVPISRSPATRAATRYLEANKVSPLESKLST